ncbi:DNA-binding LacI/PurR family transcriptional regulator [Allostreptomyces psammosilenae]|uniref:DNA-binding LacI/PurR family transcriptional regulator n=1 Tax=Allostreptomyces psammosilenae TaxID=1892865 RepID=A0A852ZNE7_9ACTN|nr:DNA-binding LacI/PurR family transcriptional regulator [Allostreptomyces psammosilenae]
MAELRTRGAVRVADLAARFGVSAGTIRRDITELAGQGRLTRVRGGAISLPAPGGEPPRQAVPEPSREPAPEAAAVPGGPVLGLLVPSVTYYYSQVVAGVRAAAAEHGARVVIGLTPYDSPRDLVQIEELCASGAEGLLIAPSGTGHSVPSELLDRLRARRVPFVLVERQPEDPFEPCDLVVSDHRQGAYAAVRHLAGGGHRKVALFASASPTASLVAEGHAEAVRRLGLDDAPRHLTKAPARRSATVAEDHARFIDDCLATGTRAALVHSDQDAIEMQQLLRARNLQVPEDLALVAYDDEIAALAEVPLTAVSPPKRQLGERAAHLLLESLAAEEPAAHRQLTLQPRLVVRESCGRANSPEVAAARG